MSSQAPQIHFALPLPRAQLATFCQKWHLASLELFGSILRDDFGPGSDVDVLVKFKAGSGPTLVGILAMQDELEALFGRKVDLLTRESIEKSRNPYRRQSTLESATVVYAD